MDTYYCTKETLQETLNTYGVAIIPNVLSEEECIDMVNKIWDYFEHITQTWDIPLNRRDESTWREFYKLFHLHSMLIQYWNAGHSQGVWDVRQNIKIVEIFAYLWKCPMDELLVSFDGLSFNLPPEITKRGWNRGNTWYHTDQSYMTPEFKCVQSCVTGLDIRENDATLSVMEGSHIYHAEFAAEFGITEKANWYKLTREQQMFYSNKGCQIKNMTCPKGSMIFWDSRTIHCGIEAKKREMPNIRAVIYLCYMPRSLSNKANIAKKQKALQELRMTTHYPCNVKLFPKYPRTYGAKLPEITEISKPELTELGLKLAGF